MALNIKKERPNGPPFFYLCSNITLNGRNKKDKLLKAGGTTDDGRRCDVGDEHGKHVLQTISGSMMERYAAVELINRTHDDVVYN